MSKTGAHVQLHRVNALASYLPVLPGSARVGE